MECLGRVFVPSCVERPDRFYGEHEAQRFRRAVEFDELLAAAYFSCDAVLADFFVNDPLQDGASIPSIQSDAGVRVSAADVNLDGIDDVITAKGPGSLPTVRVYQLGAVDPVTKALFPVLREIRHFDTFDGGSAFGLNVGGSD